MAADVAALQMAAHPPLLSRICLGGCQGPFCLAQAVPPPSDRALGFSADIEPPLASTFRRPQLSAAVSLSQAASPTEASSIDLIPSSIRPSAGKLNLAALLAIMTQCGMGGRRWRRRFSVSPTWLGILFRKVPAQVST